MPLVILAEAILLRIPRGALSRVRLLVYCGRSA